MNQSQAFKAILFILLGSFVLFNLYTFYSARRHNEKPPSQKDPTTITPPIPPAEEDNEFEELVCPEPTTIYVNNCEKCPLPPPSPPVQPPPRVPHTVTVPSIHPADAYRLLKNYTELHNGITSFKDPPKYTNL
jgi:hypothetical protein